MPKNLQAQRRGKGGSVWRAKRKGNMRVDYFPIRDIFDKGETLMGQIVDIITAPIFTAPLAKILTEDFREFYTIAPEGVYVGQKIEIGANASPNAGNITLLKNVNPGTFVCNIEHGNHRIARVGGTFAILEEISGNRAKIILPSKKDKFISINSIVTVGKVANGERVVKPLVRAGANFYKHKARGKKYPNIKGVSMNAVNHPHGGKEPRLGHPTTVSRNAPPGAKVGLIAARRSGRKKKM